MARASFGKSFLIVGVAAGLTAGCTAVDVVTHSVDADPVDAPAGTYELAPRHSSVHFKVSHLDFSLYVGRFNTVEATLDFVPENPVASGLDVTIDAASIDTNDRELEELIRDQALETDDHPEIRFVSTGATRTGPSTGTVTGDLTLAGVTRPVTLDVTFNGGAENPLEPVYTLGFAATGSFDRSEFGVGNWIPAVGREVTVEIQAEFTQPRD